MYNINFCFLHEVLVFFSQIIRDTLLTLFSLIFSDNRPLLTKFGADTL